NVRVQVPGAPPASDHLYDRAVRVLDVEAVLDVLLRIEAVCLQLVGRGLPVETVDREAEVIDDPAGRALVPQRHDGAVASEPQDLIRLVLADRLQAEHGLIE